MSIAVDTKQERLNLRIPSYIKRKIERAASFEGKTISNFILTSATVLADEVISNNEIKILNGKNAVNFIEALEKPVKFNNKLTVAFEKHSQRVICDE